MTSTITFMPFILDLFDDLLGLRSPQGSVDKVILHIYYDQYLSHIRPPFLHLFYFENSGSSRPFQPNLTIENMTDPRMTSSVTTPP